MKLILKLTVLLVLVLAGVGTWRGWWHFQSGGADGGSGVTVTVDKDKLKADERKVIDKAKDAEKKVEDKVHQ